MPNNATKAAIAPAAQFIGVILVIAAVWLGLSYYSKRTAEDIAADNARPPSVNISPMRAAEATTAPSVAFPATAAAPVTVDPAAIEMAVLRDRLQEVERQLLQARIQADANIARMREVREQTPPTMLYVQQQPALMTAPVMQIQTDTGRYISTVCRDYAGGAHYHCSIDRLTGQRIR